VWRTSRWTEQIADQSIAGAQRVRTGQRAAPRLALTSTRDREQRCKLQGTKTLTAVDVERPEDWPTGPEPAGRVTDLEYYQARAARLKAEIDWLKAGGKDNNAKDSKR